MNNLIKKDHFLAYICGNCGSGKSNLTKYIIKHLYATKKIDICVLFSPTAKISEDGAYNFLPDSLIHKRPTDIKIKNLLKFQAKNKAKKLNMLVVFDDCLSAFNKNSSVLNNFMSTHRHFRISVIFCSQYLKGVNPTWRSLFNYIAISKPSNYQDIENYKKIWLSDVKDLPQHFNKYCNQKYRFCFIDLNSDAKTKYKSVKAPIVKDFKVNYNC